MKKIFILCFIVSLCFFSCVYTEEKTPAQDFMILFEENDPTLSFSSRIKWTEIDTTWLPGRQIAYDIHVPAIRWGRGIFLGYTYRSNDPEVDRNLFYISRGGKEIYSISIAEIKALKYITIDTKNVFILPSNKP